MSRVGVPEKLIGRVCGWVAVVLSLKMPDSGYDKSPAGKGVAQKTSLLSVLPWSVIRSFYYTLIIMMSLILKQLYKITQLAFKFNYFNNNFSFLICFFRNE